MKQKTSDVRDREQRCGIELEFRGDKPRGRNCFERHEQAGGLYNAANSAPYLAGTGSLLIGTPVATNATSITTAFAGGTLTLSWPADHTGWRLQTQTNSLTAGLGTNWATVANSSGTNQIFVPVSPTNASVFFRLIYP